MNIFFIAAIILGLGGVSIAIDKIRDKMPLPGILLAIIFGLTSLLIAIGSWQYVETH